MPIFIVVVFAFSCLGAWLVLRGTAKKQIAHPSNMPKAIFGKK